MQRTDLRDHFRHFGRVKQYLLFQRMGLQNFENTAHLHHIFRHDIVPVRFVDELEMPHFLGSRKKEVPVFLDTDKDEFFDIDPHAKTSSLPSIFSLATFAWQTACRAASSINTLIVFISRTSSGISRFSNRFTRIETVLSSAARIFFFSFSTRISR